MDMTIGLYNDPMCFQGKAKYIFIKLGKRKAIRSLSSYFTLFQFPLGIMLN